MRVLFRDTFTKLDAFFDRRVDILEFTGVRDSFGEVQKSWSVLADHAGLKAAIGRREFGQLVAQDTVTERVDSLAVMLMGSFPDIDTTMRVRDDEAVEFDIIGVTQAQTRDLTELRVKRVM